MLDSDWEGHLEILLAAAEADDAGNLVGLRREEGLSPDPADNLSQRKELGSHLRPRPKLMRPHSVYQVT